jgi:hypothetical protein
MGLAAGAASDAEHRRENRQSRLAKLFKKAMIANLGILVWG